MKKSSIIVLAAIVIIALACIGVWFLRDSSKPYADKPEAITVGVPMMLDSSALVYIADDQHFFTGNGLNVTIHVYDAGLYAVDDMLNGTNDIAVATEFVFVGKALQHQNVTSVGSISRY
jgi:ABC-type nitrate/sulfonate/bicarbonate transport system substrate-binding protein